MTTSTRAIRNIAIIAHVDHGKTTLVDKLLRAAGTFRANQEVQERVMDSGDLERERGITILAKNCAVEYEGTHINIIDTPGHADFGGEVERVLSMVDGVLLLVDAVEGPMPQTRFVTRKALALGLKPIVVINKIDRPGARPDWVLNQTFDLFDKLGATEEQLDFPVIYCSALEGVAGYSDNIEELKKVGNMRAIFDTVIEKVPVRDDDPDGPLQLQICSLDYSSYVGKIGIGRVHRGRIHAGEDVCVMNGPDDTPKKVKVNQILMFEGLDRKLVDSAEAGDIVLVNGIEELSIGTIEAVGEVILSWTDQINEGYVKCSAFEGKICGVKAVFMNTNVFNSNVFKSYQGEYEVMVPFRYEKTGLVRFSIYADHNDKVNCAEMAERFGGGGHVGAAGFQLDMEKEKDLQLFIGLLKTSELNPE